tara:strand:+ start:6123 stop:6362 length:240 start_codon:yes stop_codon:yes gene_type:complete
MEIYAHVTHKVNIEPKDVIQKLIEKSIGNNGFLFKEDEKYYRGHAAITGPYSVDTKQEISKQKYQYIEALELILKELKN